MRNLKPAKLSEFVKKLQNEGKSPSQIRKELSIVDKFFKWALRSSILSQNKYEQLSARFAEIESTLKDSPTILAIDKAIPQYQHLKERELNARNPFTKLWLHTVVGIIDILIRTKVRIAVSRLNS